MYLAIIILPLLGSIISGFFGRKVGVSGAQIITCTCVIITTLLATAAFTEVVLNNTFVSVCIFRWLDSESLYVLWGFNFDSLTVSMLIPVLIISSLVHIYSIGYMSHDPHNQRFFSYLSLFTFMMVTLVTANNFLLMFVGWEGVGVCSYLLVSFWFTRIAANQSSMSAFLTNRVGDCFLTLGMFTILWTFGNLDYSTVFSLAPYINENAITIIGICLLIGAMAKSSQIGLHVWLPLAMEGPTPVSALIHAATMVTAGVYLLMRASPLIEYSSTVLISCLWIGSITTVFSSLIGLFQQDIKKVIAYSTMSQLGMMVIAVGFSSYNLALFHLVNHAFYKGLLFLGAGAVIHAVADNQDFRKYGGLLSFLPLTYTVMLIASLSLVAFPFMTGFYSKDFILESVFGQFKYSGIAVYFIAVIGAVFTTLYSFKVLYLTFITNPNGPLVNYKNAHEGDIFMSLPLMVLALFSVFFGYICKDMFIGLGTNLFTDNSLFIHPTHENVLNTEFGVKTTFKLLPFVFTLVFSALSLTFMEFIPKYLIYFKSTRLGYNVFSFFSLRFLIEFIYNKFISRFILKLGGQTTKVLDKGSVELIGPHGLEKGVLNLSENLSMLDSGVITSYALYILMALLLYVLMPYVFYGQMSLLILILYGLYIVNKKNGNVKSKLDNKFIVQSFLTSCVQFLKFSCLFSIYVLSSSVIALLLYNNPHIIELVLYYLEPRCFLVMWMSPTLRLLKHSSKGNNNDVNVGSTAQETQEAQEDRAGVIQDLVDNANYLANADIDNASRQEIANITNAYNAVWDNMYTNTHLADEVLDGMMAALPEQVKDKLEANTLKLEDYLNSDVPDNCKGSSKKGKDNNDGDDEGGGGSAFTGTGKSNMENVPESQASDSVAKTINSLIETIPSTLQDAGLYELLVNADFMLFISSTISIFLFAMYSYKVLFFTCTVYYDLYKLSLLKLYHKWKMLIIRDKSNVIKSKINYLLNLSFNVLATLSFLYVASTYLMSFSMCLPMDNYIFFI